MTRFNVSRRKVLAGLGTIGIASAGAGLGTTAFFSDEESLEGSLEAGRLDLKLDYRATYVPGDRLTPFDSASSESSGVRPDPNDHLTLTNGDEAYVLGQVPDWRNDDGEDAGMPVDEQEWGDLTKAVSCDIDDPTWNALVDGEAGATFELADVKPKDKGEFTISLHHCDNRAYLWMRSDYEDDDNGLVEPEVAAMDPDALNDSDVPDFSLVGSEGGAGELDDFVYVEAHYDTDCDNTRDGAGELDVVLAIDVSGSMLYEQYGGVVSGNTSKIDLVEAASNQFVETVFGSTLDAQIGAVFFGSPDAPNDGISTVPLTDDGSTLTTDPAAKAGTGALDTLRDEVGTTSQTGTNLPDGIDAAQALLDGGRAGAEKYMIVLGDGGQHNSDGDATARATDAKDAGTTIVSIAFGANADDALLMSLATDPSVNFYDVEANGATLAAEIQLAFDTIFASLLGEVTFYRGSLGGFLELAADGINLDPVGVAQGDAAPENAACLVPGVHCIAVSWYLPCYYTQTDGMGFGQLETSNPDYPTFADEIADRLDVSPADLTDITTINVVQTDSVGWTLQFYAVQCRHNMANDNPFTQAA